jgi:ABC-type lipoprotein release transport system permease subunit
VLLVGTLALAVAAAAWPAWRALRLDVSRLMQAPR